MLHCNLVHFATHAVNRPDNAIYSWIRLHDQDLSVDDIYDLKLAGNPLVVLSACETGLGKIERGEGVLSLARGFTYAGAKGLIASLWSVNERSTATIISDFYSHLKTVKRNLKHSASPN